MVERVLPLSRDHLRVVAGEVEFRRCRDDPAYFLEHYGHITSPFGGDDGMTSFDLYPYQRRFLKLLEKHQRIAVLKGRQIGFTTMMGAWLLWGALFKPNRRAYVVLHREDDAREAVSRVKGEIWGHLPKWLLENPKMPSLANPRATQSLKFSNGSSIETSPAGEGDPVRSRTAAVVVLDEIDKYKYPERSVASAAPAVGDAGTLVALSTSDGPGGWLHRLWDEDDCAWRRVFYGWRSVPSRNKRWHAGQAAALDSVLMAREHPSSAEEAFKSAALRIFGEDLLKQCCRVRKPRGRGYLHRPKGFARVFEPDPGAQLSVWEFPEEGASYVIGADVSGGASEGGAWSVAVVLRVDSPELCAVWRGKPDPDAFGEVLSDLGWFYNRAVVGVEANNHGLSTLAELRRLIYPRLYRRKSLNKFGGGYLAEYGWLTNKASKPLMIDELRRALRSGFVVVTCSEVREELSRFVRVPASDSMRGRPFDDRVMALAVAAQMLPFALHGEDLESGELVPFCEDWWRWVARAQGVQRESDDDSRGGRVGGVALV